MNWSFELKTTIEYMSGSELKVFVIPPGSWIVSYDPEEKSLHLYKNVNNKRELVGVFNNVQSLWKE